MIDQNSISYSQLAEHDHELTSKLNEERQRNAELSSEIVRLRDWVSSHQATIDGNINDIRNLCTERDAIKAENARLAERVKRLEDVILWLDGRKDNFPLRPADKGIFWWRKEMMDRASIAAGKADQRAGGEVAK